MVPKSTANAVIFSDRSIVFNYGHIVVLINGKDYLNFKAVTFSDPNIISQRPSHLHGCIFFLLTLLRVLFADLTTLLCLSTVHIVGSYTFKLLSNSKFLSKHKGLWPCKLSEKEC